LCKFVPLRDFDFFMQQPDLPDGLAQPLYACLGNINFNWELSKNINVS